LVVELNQSLCQSLKVQVGTTQNEG